MVNHCCYCNNFNGDTTDYINHFETFHNLPVNFVPKKVQDIEKSTGYKQVESAFDGSLQTFQLDRKILSIDLFEMLYQQKNQLQNLVREKVRDGPKKLQLTLDLKLVKPKLNETSEDTLTIFISSDRVPVYFFGITDEDYYRLMEQLTTRLFSFATHGSGWVLLEIKSFILKFSSFSILRGNSYLALPFSLQSCQYLINVRNI